MQARVAIGPGGKPLAKLRAEPIDEFKPSPKRRVSLSPVTSTGRVRYLFGHSRDYTDVWDPDLSRFVETGVLAKVLAIYWLDIQNPGRGFDDLRVEILVHSETQFDRRNPAKGPRRLAEDVVPHAERMFNAILTVANAAGLPIEVKPPVPPEAPKPAAGRLVVRQVGGDFKQGVWLDGQSPVEFEAVLTDSQGKLLAGVPVDLAVVDRDLPRRGQLSYLGARTTDAQGRVRGRYLPPRVEERELSRQGPILGFQARAMPKGAAPIDANENVLARALVPAFLRLSRDPYVPVERVPVQLPSLRAGSVRGSVVYRFSRTAFDSSAGPATRTTNEYPVAGATVELSTGGKRLGEAVTDANGKFQLDFAVERSSGPPPQLTLPDPIAFTEYGPVPKGRLAQARVDLGYLADPKTYGYQVGPLLAQIDERFPQRLAAAATAPAIEKELDRLHRVGLLIAALWKTHDLVAHSAGEWAESLTAVVESLLDVFNPLDKLKTEGTAGELQKWAELARDRSPVKAKIVQRVIAGLASQLKKVAESEPLRDAAEKLYEATAWEATRGAITSHLLKEKKREDEEPRWKEPIVDALMGRYRDLAQKELERAARLWEADKIPVGGRQGPLFAARYQEIAAHKDQVTARQLRLDLYKANVKLGMDVVGNGIKIIATGYGAAPVAEGVELVEKGLKTVNVGLDGFQGYLWLKDYSVGMRGISQFAQAALAHCIGAAC